MTAPRLSNNLAYTPQMIDCSGQFVVPANATTPNQQILPSNLTIGTVGVSQLTPIETQSPQGCLFPVFCTPNSAAVQPSGNAQRLPPGIASGAQLAGSEFVIDCSGFQSDIISAQAGIMTTTRGAATVDAFVSCVDNVNKLVYVQVQGWTSASATAAPTGSIVTFQIVMKDCLAV